MHRKKTRNNLNNWWYDHWNHMWVCMHIGHVAVLDCEKLISLTYSSKTCECITCNVTVHWQSSLLLISRRLTGEAIPKRLWIKHSGKYPRFLCRKTENSLFRAGFAGLFHSPHVVWMWTYFNAVFKKVQCDARSSLRYQTIFYQQSACIIAMKTISFE